MNSLAATISTVIFGIVFIAFGFVYLHRPTLYRRGIWLKTSIAIRTLSERSYIRYMRGLGVLYIIMGIGLLIAAGLKVFSN